MKNIALKKDEKQFFTDLTLEENELNTMVIVLN